VRCNSRALLHDPPLLLVDGAIAKAADIGLERPSPFN
jgi:hypothetical protein